MEEKFLSSCLELFLVFMGFFDRIYGFEWWYIVLGFFFVYRVLVYFSFVYCLGYNFCWLGVVYEDRDGDEDGGNI